MNKAVRTSIALILSLSFMAPIFAQEPEEVSIITLIANPQEYNGKFVRVQGYVVLTFEGNAVYLSAEHAKHGLARNGLWLEISNEIAPAGKFSNKYCLIEGTFDAAHKGHMSLWSGALRNIKRIQELDIDITE